MGYASIALSITLLAGASSVSAQGHNRHSNGHQNNSAKIAEATPVSTPVMTPSPVSKSLVTPPVVTPAAAASAATGEIRFSAYTTGYAALDNTPGGSTRTNLGGHAGDAGGTGTYHDPITLAVGHSIINGQDIGDYPYGTRFYVPNLRKYFTAADSCGDGNTPQNGPCHSGFSGHVWLDIYVGGSLQSAVLNCEESITDLHLVIQNPAANYSVVPGAVFDTGCKQYGDTIISSR
jgi:hypothetical protein